MAYPSHPFVFNYVKYVLLEKFSEVLSCDTNVNVIVYLDGNADAVALSNAKAAGKNDLILDMMLRYRLLKKLYNILRALEMTRRTDTNLNKQHKLIPLPKFRVRRTHLRFRG